MSPAATVAVSRSVTADYVELTKPRITLMVVLTAFVGYALGATGSLLTGRLAVELNPSDLQARAPTCRSITGALARSRSRAARARRPLAPRSIAIARTVGGS